MTGHLRRFAAPIAALCCAWTALAAWADPQVLERARQAIASGNSKQAYADLAPLQDKLTGQPEYDYLLGVAALDSGKLEEAIVAFERVLALIPNHAGAQMDLSRAYYAAGSYDLAAAGFLKLRESSPPPAAQQAINRYLDAIEARKHQNTAGWRGFSELGLGYDSNITGVPVDFGGAALQSFNLVGIDPTGNAIKRSAAFAHGGLGAEYSRPLSRGWSVFAGTELHGRAYHEESDFNSISADFRGGGAYNHGPDQWRLTANYLEFKQKGDSPSEPPITNDRRMAGVTGDWRRALDPKTQVGATLQLNRVKFRDNEIDDFDQIFVAASWLRSFERKGVPMLYLTVFGSDDRALNTFADGVTTKSKYLAGARAYLQYSITTKLQGFAAGALINRRDKDDYARSTTVQKGRDNFGELAGGLYWQFRERCGLRLQYAFSTNRSNIDIYDFNRHEVTSTIRCELG